MREAVEEVVAELAAGKSGDQVTYCMRGTCLKVIDQLRTCSADLFRRPSTSLRSLGMIGVRYDPSGMP